VPVRRGTDSKLYFLETTSSPLGVSGPFDTVNQIGSLVYARLVALDRKTARLAPPAAGSGSAPHRQTAPGREPAGFSLREPSNGLVQSWPEIARVAGEAARRAPGPGDVFDEGQW
jgi:hypothetical protein